MEIIKTRQRRPGGIKSEVKQKYAHPIQFYSLPPEETISLQEFEEFAVERLKVLKAVETASVRHVRGSTEYVAYLEKEIKNTKFKSLLKVSYGGEVKEDETDARRLDHISHFILRLAYCRSEDLRRWFLQQELDLFRFRFQRETKDSRLSFLKINNLGYKPIPDEEKTEVLPYLVACDTPARVEVNEYYKVHFTEALDLVRGKRVYLEQGFAFVAQDDLASILLSVYRTRLSHALAVTCRALPHLEEDDRLLPMLCGLSKRYLGQDYNNKKTTVGQITADMIDLLSRTSFPPCMQQLHQGLRSNHHLKHGGRMQYGLFLKGIGLSLDEAMKFWRTEFVKGMDPDKFDKQYSYNIRHNYGKEGKRADYTPYSCMKIIMSNTPGQGDSHGCPFRHCDGDLLRQKLRAQNISKDAIDEISKFAKEGHYQLACGRYFDASHNISGDNVETSINHPNQYFEESQNIRKDGGKKLNTPNPGRVIRVSASQNSQAVKTASQLTDTQNTGLDEMEDDFPMEELDSMLQETQ
ncbi:DNA primase large subunit-like [Haliotis rufescens]|uniref:DNA primase large subunit-like n=1 Tax=Haliotis rufescens TaxID=6454 RepID=UPI00201F3165|nr:DNA primase large subunit-like [Haliotis rufescens]